MSRLRDSGIPRASSFHHLQHAAVQGATASARTSLSGAASGMERSQASVQAETTQATASASASSGPYASLTRMLLIGQPSNFVRNLAGRKWRVSGPISLLLFLFGLVVAILAGVRTALVRRVKSCKCCRGYGIVRCRLCNGEGAVEWRGKNNHQETCPLCMTKRFVTCPDCGGHYHRRMFSHTKGTGPVMVPEFMGNN